MSTDRRAFLQNAALASGALVANSSWSVNSGQTPNKLRDVAWVWEGAGLDPGVKPSIYGLGQGATYLGIDRVNFLFHPNDDHALKLLGHVKELTCDITKWAPYWDEHDTLKWNCPGAPLKSIEEAHKVSALTKQYPNITGAFFDDMLGRKKADKWKIEQYGELYKAVKSVNPDLKLWSVVYTHELKETEFWQQAAPCIDIVNLWIWNSSDIDMQEQYIQECRERFPDKPIVMGCYLRDYSKRTAVPMGQIKKQLDGVYRGISKGSLQGFSILAAVLIDTHRSQADAVRDFIAVNS